MKKCTKCDQIKEFENFKKDKSVKCGYRSWCKLCDKEYRKNKHESIYKYNKNYYKNNRKRIVENRSINNKQKRLNDFNFKLI